MVPRRGHLFCAQMNIVWRIFVVGAACPLHTSPGCVFHGCVCCFLTSAHKLGPHVRVPLSLSVWPVMADAWFLLPFFVVVYVCFIDVWTVFLDIKIARSLHMS